MKILSKSDEVRKFDQVRLTDYEAQHRNKMLTTGLQFLHLLLP